MKRIVTAIHTVWLVSALVAAAFAAFAAERTAPIVIDHRCTDLDTIPPEAIEQAKNWCKWHYARLSHGRQIMTGFERIEAADPFYEAIWPYSGFSLPNEPNALCIYTAPLEPESYWRGSGINTTRSTFINNPALNISAFSWCEQLNTESASYVQEYLNAMQSLENEFPGITFVYFTGTAQYNGAYGYNRSLRNEQIRSFCLANNKVLYDFEDLDSWWRNPETGRWEQATYVYSGRTIAVEHPMLAGNDSEHTSYESCEQKGRAAWWLMAVLAGWSGILGVNDPWDGETPDPPAADSFGLSCYPNPFNPTTTFTFFLPSPVHAKLVIYDAAGRPVRILVDRVLAQGRQHAVWNGADDSGGRVASGVYFSRISAGKVSTSRKILLLR